MKTRICWALGFATIWAVSCCWIATAAAQAPNDNWHGAVKLVAVVDESGEQGSAFASDSENFGGSAFVADPNWAGREPGALPQAGSQPGRVRAMEIAARKDQNAPPVPPPDVSEDSPAPPPRVESPETHNNHSNGNGNGSNGQPSDGHCEHCDHCDQCDSHCDHCCDECCDECCHRQCGCGCPMEYFDRCPLYCCDEEPGRLFDCCWGQQHDVDFFGWIDGGIMGNGDNPRSHFNGPVTFPDRDDAQLNQFYGVLQRTAGCDNCGWFFGGRIDMYWGSDFAFTTAAGLDGTPAGNVPRWQSTDSFLYGWSMPQLYGEVDYNDLQFKIGHFYSPIGYEVAPAVGNFFYTHSYSRQYGEPFTHTGMLASQPINENWKWYAGIDNGWNAFDCDSRANFLGGLCFHDDCWGTLSFMLQTGDDSTHQALTPGVGPFANRTTYSLVWQRDFTDRFTYVLEHNLGIQQDAETLQGRDTAEWYGLTNYLFYKINCCWELGYRFEVFRDDDGFAVTGIRPGNPISNNRFGGNFYEMSLGLNWKANANIVVRPEIRWDWFNCTDNNIGNQFPFNDTHSQFLFGLDAIVRF